MTKKKLSEKLLFEKKNIFFFISKKETTHTYIKKKEHIISHNITIKIPKNNLNKVLNHDQFEIK